MRALVICLLLTVGTGFAGEYAVMTSGVRLHIDRHELQGERVRLYTGPGYTELPATAIQTFEVEESVAAEPAPPVPPPPPPVVKAPVKVPTATELADAAAEKYGLPPQLVRSVMLTESAMKPEALSPKGAIGLMQLMPQTAEDLGANPHDPAQNVDAGVRYLRDLLVKYDWKLWPALAAYNAGPGAVGKYHGIPPYRETINYIDRVNKLYTGQ